MTESTVQNPTVAPSDDGEAQGALAIVPPDPFPTLALAIFDNV